MKIGEEVYPIGTYINVFFVVIVFLVTDYLRYKPIMIINGISGIIYYSLLLGSPTTMKLKIGQVFQVIFRAAEVAYYTYMFAQIKNKDQYQIAYSRVRASVLVGKCGSGLLSQVVISYLSPNLTGYIYLIYISIFGMVLTTIWSLIIPPVKFSLYFYKQKEPVINFESIDTKKIIQNKVIEPFRENIDRTYTQNDLKKLKCSEVIRKLWLDFKVSYTDVNLLKWSVWLSLSLCGYIMIGQYIQILWQKLEKQDINAHLMNAAVDSLTTILSAVATYSTGRINGSWDKYGEYLIAIVSMGLGCILIVLSSNKSLNWSYGYYIIFCCTYQTMLTISSAEIAKFLKRDCYALVFGFNKFITSILQSFFVIVIVKDTFFSFNIEEQIYFYGLYFAFLGFVYILLFLLVMKGVLKKNILINTI
ncbi:thiamine transporter 1-like isoform X2 [Sipha flava]|uniref:Thiamine transporter 1-like isoform X2 n=1 Tax=Sipha flava TaxID=143950 RepID=A0A8B8FUT8_9HEMI|nr:thiamine transporter 1-like isoform X2 [Sipha flava]